MSSIEKYEVEQRVRIMLLRHRGSTVKVIHDYQDEYGITLTPDYIEKIYRKLKREVQRDEIKWVGYHFAQEILSQSHQIQQILLDQYKSCEGQDVITVSNCCHDAIKPDPITPQIIRCRRCGQVCQILREVRLDPGIEHLKLSIVDRMRKENEFYLEFLKELGFVGSKKEEDQNPQLQAGKYISVSQSNPPKKLAQSPTKPKENPSTEQAKVENLDPREQQLLIDKFVDVEFESDDKSGPNQSK